MCNRTVENRLDVLHLAVDVGDVDVFADAVGLGENDGQPGDEIAEDALQGEADANARHADAGDERGDGNAKLVQDHDECHHHHGEPDDADEERLDGRLQLMPVQPAPKQVAEPAGDGKADDEDDDRANDLHAVVGGEIDELQFQRVHGGEDVGSVHIIPIVRPMPQC